MMYIVIRHFTDLQDNNYKYVEGDTYPREGYEPSAERIEELSTDNNRLNAALIEPIVEAGKTDTVEDITEEMPEISETSEVSEDKPKKRGRRKSDD